MARLLACLVVGWLCLWFSPRALAADCHTSEENCPQASAYAACRADMSRRQGEGFTISVACVQGGTQQLPYYECRYSNAGGNGCGYNPFGHALYRWNSTSSCSAKPPLLNVAYGGTLGGCSAGCEYAPGIGEPGDSVTRVGSGAQSVTRVSRMVPTGAACVVGEEFKEVQTQTVEQCQKQGNLTQCIATDGRTCAVASSGKKFCWQPNEAGVKLSGNEAAVKSPEGAAIKQPPKAPANGGDWQQGGTGTVSVTSGGVTNNYNTTNYNSTYGSQGSGANGGGADGEGNGGSGEGEGEGNGSASGGGTCTQPYVCSGDPIMCSLGQQMWLSRCGDRKGDANGDGIPDALVGDAPQNPDPGEDSSPTRWGINVGADMLDTENIFGAGSCPLMPSFSIMGVTVAPSEFPQWCTLVAVMRAVVLLMGAFIAISLLMGGS